MLYALANVVDDEERHLTCQRLLQHLIYGILPRVTQGSNVQALSVTASDSGNPANLLLLFTSEGHAFI